MDKPSIAKKITYLKELKGLNTNKLANLAGISQSFLRDVEAGKKQMTIETLSYVCDALGISLQSFFECEEKEDISTMLIIDDISREVRKLNNEQKLALLAFLKKL